MTWKKLIFERCLSLLLILGLLLPLSACSAPRGQDDPWRSLGDEASGQRGVDVGARLVGRDHLPDRRVKSPVDFQLAQQKRDEAERYEAIQREMLRRERSEANRRAGAIERESLPDWPIIIPQYFIKNEAWSLWHWFAQNYPAVQGSDDLSEAIANFCSETGVDPESFSIVYQSLDGDDSFSYQADKRYRLGDLEAVPLAFLICELLEEGEFLLGDKVMADVGIVPRGPKDPVASPAPPADDADDGDDGGSEGGEETGEVNGEETAPKDGTLAEDTGIDGAEDAPPETDGEAPAAEGDAPSDDSPDAIPFDGSDGYDSLYDAPYEAAEGDGQRAMTIANSLQDILVRPDAEELRYLEDYLKQRVPPYTSVSQRLAERFGFQSLHRDLASPEELAKVLEEFIELGPENPYLSLMADNWRQNSEHPYFTALLPQNVSVMHTYAVQGGQVHNLGFVLDEDRPYLFVFMSRDAELIPELGLLLYCWNQRGSEFNYGVFEPKNGS